MTTPSITYEDNEIIELRGYRLRVQIKHDDSQGEPWKECEGYGVIKRRRSNSREKHPWERFMGDNYIYDMRATRAKAKKDGWGLDEEALIALSARLGRVPTGKQMIAESIEKDYAFLLTWINDEWHWHGYIVTLLDADDEEMDDYSDSCWGFDFWLYDDTKNRYFYEQITDAAEHIVQRAEKEAQELRYWNERDVMTEAV